CTSTHRPQVVEAGFEAHHARIPLHVQAFPEINAISVVSRSDSAATDPDHRTKTAELLMRANQRLTLGAFELLWDEGETLFRVTNFFPAEARIPSVLTAMVEIAVVEMDRILPLLHHVQEASGLSLVSLNISAMLDSPEFLPEVAPHPASAEDEEDDRPT
ncbi:MAG: hypothetical protein AAGJ31_00160, partial [Verrucomicrobiota bacterium]